MRQLSLPMLLPRQRGVELNKVEDADRPAHWWYRFVLSFPPHLVRDYVERFGLQPGQRVLDPFCGTGTTIVECRKLGIHGVGIEAHPMSHFASRVKVDWSPEAAGLERSSVAIAEAAIEELAAQGIEDTEPATAEEVARLTPILRKLPEELAALLLTNSISPLPLHKTLVLLEAIHAAGPSRYRDHQILALAKALTGPIGNLHFGPEVGIGPAKTDAPVIALWLDAIRVMADDLSSLDNRGAPALVHHADSRDMPRVVPRCSIDAVITSPPYPNEKDYTRTTRLESILLGFIPKSEVRKTSF